VHAIARASKGQEAPRELGPRRRQCGHGVSSVSAQARLCTRIEVSAGGACIVQ